MPGFEQASLSQQIGHDKQRDMVKGDISTIRLNKKKNMSIVPCFSSTSCVKLTTYREATRLEHDREGTRG